MSNVDISPQALLLPGAFIGTGVTVAAHAVIGPNACLLGTDDGSATGAIVESGARIGGNATVLAGVRVGANARVEPGAVVARSVPPNAIVGGNPAVIEGYVDAAGGTLHANTPSAAASDASKRGMSQGLVKGVTLHEFQRVTDLRGSLSVGEFEREIPFSPKRYFLVFDVPTVETRGEHAHLACHQFLVAVSGSVSVVADDGANRAEYLLDRSTMGVFLPAMTWGIQYRYSHDAVLLVFASEYYNPADYIRDYDEFLARVSAITHDQAS